VSPPGGRAQPLKGPGGSFAPGPVHSRVDAVMWNEVPVGLSGLDMIVQPVTSMLKCVGLMGCPKLVRE